MTQNHIKQAETLICCLKGKNYFQRNAQENLEKVTPETLFMYAIVVEKNFNVDKVTFEYKPEKGVFVRTKFTGRIENQTKENYERQMPKCRYCETPCYKGEYTIEEFIALIINGKFEPIDLYPI